MSWEGAQHRVVRAGARVLALCLVLMCGGAEGAVVHLRNGDRVSGLIKEVDQDRLVLSSRWAGEVGILFSEILKVEGSEVALPSAEPPPAAQRPPVPPAKPTAPVKPKKSKVWHGDLLLGMNLIFSEKNQQIYTGRMKLSYAEEGFRNSLDYLASYGRTDGLVTANRMDGTSKTDFDVGNEWYVYNLGRAGYDEIRKVDVRYELGPGGGYHLVRAKAFKVNVELGSNYKVENRSDGSGNELFVARAAENLAWTVSPRLTLEEQFEFLPEMEDWGTYRFRFETSVRYQLLGNVSLNLTLIDQYDTRPARSVQQNDLQVRSSLGVVF